MTVDGESLISAAEGNGPVNALDLALRKDLGKYQRFIADLELLDYRVRIFQGGSDAVTRVLIECGDGTGARWSTVGVSANIIDASFQALVDSITYKLRAVRGRLTGPVQLLDRFGTGPELQSALFPCSIIYIMRMTHRRAQSRLRRGFAASAGLLRTTMEDCLERSNKAED